ncbi:MAG: DUF4348 domain-containing protein [Mucilaginibacter sp.]|uniref:DUF4348 domain-containing protein n=1 Tax=Mucilaginibacter sp. TaxID=1882438 RepID=UPI003266DB71
MKHIARYGLLLIGILFTLVSCTNNKKVNAVQTETVKPDTADKNFDTFFTRFETDSVFQLSRISFPIKKTILEDDTTKTVNEIKRNDWKYHNILTDKSEKYIIDKIKVNQSEYKTAISIEDTGVHIEYNFVNKDGKWWLVDIVDNGD